MRLPPKARPWQPDPIRLRYGETSQTDKCDQQRHDSYAAGSRFVFGLTRARSRRSFDAYLRRCDTGFAGMSG